MRNNKLTVFLAAIAALGVMTVLSVRAHLCQNNFILLFGTDWSLDTSLFWKMKYFDLNIQFLQSFSVSKHPFQSKQSYITTSRTLGFLLAPWSHIMSVLMLELCDLHLWQMWVSPPGLCLGLLWPPSYLESTPTTPAQPSWLSSVSHHWGFFP